MAPREEMIERPTAYARYVLGLLLLVSIVAYSDRLILGFLIDPIKQDLGLSDTQAGLLTGLAFSVFYAIMGLPLGRAVDVYPRNAVLAACIAGWSLCTMFCGLATSAVTLFLARCGIGAGEAVMNPSAVSLIGDRYPRNAVVGALSLYSIGVVGGGGLAIVLGGQLIDYFTSLGRIDVLGFDDVPVWRVVFIAVGAPGLLLAALVHFTIADPERRSRARDGAISGESAIRPEESLREVAAWIWSRRKVYGPLFAGLVAYGFYNYSVLGWYPVMFGRTFGATTGEISLWYGSAYLVGGIAGALSAGPLEKRLRRRGHVDAPALILLVSVAMASVPAVAGPLMPDFHLAVALFVIGIFMAALQTSMAFSAFVLITPADRRGIVVAIYVMVMNLTGGSFGTVIIGLLSDHVFGPAHVAYSLSLMGGIALPLSAICYASLRPHYRQAAMAEEVRLSNPNLAHSAAG